VTPQQEQALLKACIAARQTKTTTSGPPSQIDTQRYLSAKRFLQELQGLWQRVPTVVLHTSELPRNSYQARDTALGRVIFTRDEEGVVRAFHNVCRHRGSQLVTNEGACEKRLVCPYHAWTYGLDGHLQGVPAESQCFPDLDKSAMGLLAIPCVEKYGFVWLCPTATTTATGDTAEQAVVAHVGEMAADLEWLQLDKLHVCESVPKTWQANWKLLVEGGIETYHFAVAHKKTIAPFFLNNIAVTDQLGQHFRTVIPNRAIDQVAQLPESKQRLRACTHINYNVLGSVGLLVQDEHIDWFRMRPIAADQTEITITSLVPTAKDELSPDQAAHWQKNMAITNTVLDEDFVIGEGIQRSIAQGALTSLQFGTAEWGLKAFNDSVDAYIGPL
jgi:phenylpropionate dioxygenase-like ring-hydroxylating dioxygenase large terminal subunit